MHYQLNGMPDRILQVWVIGEGLDAAEQFRAPKGTRFIPYSQFPPRTVRKDCCAYSTTPAMSVPKTLQNVHSCEVIKALVNCNSSRTALHDLIKLTKKNISELAAKESDECVAHRWNCSCIGGMERA
jgi:TusA-related sulfurtransferase